MDSNFTKDTTALMNEARLCAIDLGTGYISTIHLLLADCKINNQHSVRNFFFKTPLAFQTFYESQRVAETSFFDSVVVESLPVTVEMEQAIRIAQKQYNGAKAVSFVFGCKPVKGNIVLFNFRTKGKAV